MIEENKWDKKIFTLLLANKSFDIKEVNDFEAVKTLIYDKTICKMVTALINKRDWEGIKFLTPGEKIGFGEYLDIIKFTNQNKSPFAATIYDSDELWQDPEIIEIYSLT